MTCYKYSITCQDDFLTVDNAQSHVTAFRPISEAARSWSDDNHISQSSVAAHLRYGGIFKYEFVANLLQILQCFDAVGWAAGGASGL